MRKYLSVEWWIVLYHGTHTGNNTDTGVTPRCLGDVLGRSGETQHRGLPHSNTHGDGKYLNDSACGEDVGAKVLGSD